MGDQRGSSPVVAEPSRAILVRRTSCDKLTDLIGSIVPLVFQSGTNPADALPFRPLGNRQCELDDSTRTFLLALWQWVMYLTSFDMVSRLF